MKKILILWLCLTYSLQVFADNLSDSNKLFNWAEENYAQYFDPPGGSTFNIENYWVRYYEKTDIYIGTLGEDVYLYGEIFDGLKHVGRIGDFVAVTDNEIKTVGNIKIMGNNAFITQTEAALEVLKNLAPRAFAKIQQYVAIIEQAEYSHMWADEIPPRYAVDDITAFYSIKWHAGAIAHEATHSELYHEYQVKHGLPVPASIWRSVEAENFCIQYQIDVMKKMNAPQLDIDYLDELAAGSACEIDGSCG